MHPDTSFGYHSADGLGIICPVNSILRLAETHPHIAEKPAGIGYFGFDVEGTLGCRSGRLPDGDRIASDQPPAVKQINPLVLQG